MPSDKRPQKAKMFTTLKVDTLVYTTLVPIGIIRKPALMFFIVPSYSNPHVLFTQPHLWGRLQCGHRRAHYLADGR